MHGTPDQVAARIISSGELQPRDTLWWDIEDFGNPSGRAWTPSELAAYADALERAGVPRSRQGVYLNLSTANGGGYQAAGVTRLWLAHYTTTTSTSVRGWPGVELWQYTKTGRLPGYAGDLDLSRSTGVKDA